MSPVDKIEINLIKLSDGERLLRLVDLPTGLALEKKLDRQLPVSRQKARLFEVFKAVLAQVQLTAA